MAKNDDVINKELNKYLITNITEIVSEYIGGIIRLSFKDSPYEYIEESDFKDHENAKNVTGIYFVKPITITDNKIFKRYKIIESIYGVPPIIKTTDLSGLFHITGRSYDKLTNGNLGDWDVSNVTNMNRIFSNSSYNSPLNDWDVSNVTDMESMFYNSGYNHPLNKWDVSSVEFMRAMFENSSYNHPLNKWDVSNVTNMRYMFYESPYNHPLNKWNVSNVSDMSGMFIFSQYNHHLNKWNVSNVDDMESMFYSSEYNHPLNEWDVSNVINMIKMFLHSEFDTNSIKEWQYNEAVILEHNNDY